MAKLKIGKLPVYKGEYQNDINYSRLNLVSYLGTTFQSLTDDNIGHPPAELSEDGGEIVFINTNYWNIIAKGLECNDNRIATDNNKGYKILKKNKSFAEQVTEENTIYEIRYDFTLSENITIPANCVLNFNGGSINGAYTITGTNTYINAGLVKIFGTDISFMGTWIISEVYPDWFGIIYNNNTVNNRLSLQKAIELSKYSIFNKVKINDGIIWLDVIDEAIIGPSLNGSINNGITLYNNCHLELSSNTYLKVIPNNSIQYSLIKCVDISNVIIEGGHLIGDVENHIGTTGEWGYGILMENVENSTIRNIESSYFWGDGITLSDKDGAVEIYNCKNIIIDNVLVKYNRRNNLSITGGTNIKVRNSEFSYAGVINGTSPKNGIDIEPWSGTQKCSNIILENCYIHDNYSYQLQLYGSVISETCNLNLVTINKCTIKYRQDEPNSYGLLPVWIRCDTTSITNSDISGLLLEYALDLSIYNCTIGNIIVSKNDKDCLIQNAKIINCCLFNYYHYFNNDSALFQINENVADLNIIGCIIDVYNNAESGKELIKFGDNVTEASKKNINFTNNTIRSKAPISYNGSKDNGNYTLDSTNASNKQNTLIPSGRNLYSYRIEGESYNEGNSNDYKVILEFPRTPNLYDIYLEPVWSDIQHTEFTKLTVATDYVNIYFLDFINGGNFIPVSINVNSNENYELTLIKNNANLNLRFVADIICRNIANITYRLEKNDILDRTPIYPKYNNAISGNTRPTVSTIGYCFFDLQLNKPIYWTGTKWIDATGADV